jgi:FSR family fosmidomycin resistance protein-like MFS transporter
VYNIRDFLSKQGKMKSTEKFHSDKVLLVSLAHFFHDIYTSFLAPLLPVLKQHYGFSLTFAGFLSVIQRMPMLLNPLIGILAERTKARYFVIFSPAVTAISMSMLGISNSKTFLIIIVLVSGISSSFFHVPSPVMIRKVSGNRVRRGMSFFMVGGELARTVGPLIALGAVELWGLDGLTKMIPVGVLASVILWIKFKNIAISDRVRRSSFSVYLGTLKEIFPVIFSIAMIILFRTSMKSALTFYLPVFLEHRGESLWFAGVSLSILQGAGVIGTFFAGNLADKIGRRNMLKISSIVTPVLMFAFLYSSGAVQLGILILIGLFMFITGPVFLAIVNDLKTGHSNLVNGVYTATTFIIGAAMVMFVGFLGDHLNLELTYKITAFIALGAIPFSFIIKTRL